MKRGVFLLVVLLMLCFVLAAVAAEGAAKRTISVKMPGGLPSARASIPSSWAVMDWFDQPSGRIFAASEMSGTDDMPKVEVRLRGQKSFSSAIDAVVKKWQSENGLTRKRLVARNRTLYKLDGSAYRAKLYQVDAGGIRYVLMLASGPAVQTSGSSMQVTYVIEAECPVKLWDDSGSRSMMIPPGQGKVISSIMASIKVP